MAKTNPEMIKLNDQLFKLRGALQQSNDTASTRRADFAAARKLIEKDISEVKREAFRDNKAGLDAALEPHLTAYLADEKKLAVAFQAEFDAAKKVYEAACKVREAEYTKVRDRIKLEFKAARQKLLDAGEKSLKGHEMKLDTLVVAHAKTMDELDIEQAQLRNQIKDAQKKIDNLAQIIASQPQEPKDQPELPTRPPAVIQSSVGA